MDSEFLRIMMIGPYPSSPDRIDGGVAAAVTYLSEALAAEPGIELVGVRIAKKYSANKAAEFKWPIEDLALGSLSLSTLYWRQRQRLASLIRKYGPQLIHAQGADLAGFLAVRCGIPALVTVHGLLGECAKYQTHFATKARARLSALLTERNTIRRANNLIVISPYVTQYYRQEITGRVYEVPNAIAPKYFRVKRATERGRILFAGRIAHGKGLLELVRAVACNVGMVSKVILAGATPDPAYGQVLRCEVEKLGLTGCVEFAGLLNEDALLDEFARAEALVLPSYQETAPMVIQQAMAAGVAVLATNVGGIPFQIRNDVTGQLFEAGDVGGLAALLRRLHANPSLSKRLGEAAKAFAVARFRSDTVARATISVYRSILQTKNVHISSELR